MPNATKTEAGIKVAASCAFRHWTLFLILAIWLGVFWRMNTGQTVVGFRDSAYLYYSYFQWIDQQWQSGQIPLWNPYCDLGYPVIGDGTSSVFYPGKLIFLLRFLSFPSRYGLYISLHVLLAAAGVYILCKELGADANGAALGAISYSFGGSVLFQTVNVVYLVSASLLPLAVFFIWRMFKRNQIGSAVGAGVVSALMILGGDPQMAYLAGLLAAGLFLLRLVRKRKTFLRTNLFWLQVRLGCLRLGVAAAVMLLLAAIQILPSYVWSQQSSRSRSNQLASSFVERIFEKPDVGTHADAALQFSQPPWSLAELFWPNISGKPFPINQRWASQFPGADRVWTPSLYVGLLTIVLALGGLRIRGLSNSRYWLTAIILLFAVASFGWYGLVWLYSEIAIGLGGDEPGELGPAVGGVYWLMKLCLPKFYLFRYPAKMFVVASLAICILAGLNFNRVGLAARSTRALLSLTVFCSICVLVFYFVRGPLFIQRFNDPLFGPLDLGGCKFGIVLSILQTLVLSSLILVIGIAHRKFPGPIISATNIQRNVLLAIVSAELLVANVWMVPQVDAKIFQRETSISLAIKELNLKQDARLVRDGMVPGRWATTNSPDRLAEIVHWQRATIHPKHHLNLSIGLLGSFSTIEHPVNAIVSEYGNRQNSDRRQLPISGVVGFDELAAVGTFQSYATTPERIVVVDSVEGLSNPVFLVAEDLDRDKSRRWEYESITPTHVSIKVTTDKPVVVLYSSLAYSGWRARLFDEQSLVEIADCQIDAGDFFLAARVPVGNFRVVFEYVPIEFWIGFWIGLISWFGLLGFAIKKFRRSLFNSFFRG